VVGRSLCGWEGGTRVPQFRLRLRLWKSEDSIRSGCRDATYNGWATRFKVDYPWQKFNFGTTLMYATGSDQKKTDARGLPGKTTPWGTTTRDVDSYVTPPAPTNLPETGKAW